MRLILFVIIHHIIIENIIIVKVAISNAKLFFLQILPESVKQIKNMSNFSILALCLKCKFNNPWSNLLFFEIKCLL
jgi:hypothetical protein